MIKRIGMTKSVFDNWQAPSMEEAINETSSLLTKALWGDGHPFREIMRQKVNDEDLAERRIKFFVVLEEEYTKHPKTGKHVTAFNVSSIMLEVAMKDLMLDYNLAGHHQMQTRYINGKLCDFIHQQGFNIPCKDPDEIESFLNFLSKDIPCIWDYFNVIKLEEY